MEVGLERANRIETTRSVGVLGKLVGAKTHYQTRQALLGYVFALPWILGLIIFWGGPILASFYFSFTDYAVIGSPRFIGLDNFKMAFGSDDQFWPSLGRTFNFTILFVPTAIAGAIALAVLLNQKLKGTNIYRTIFFIPHLIPAVALAVLWIYLLQPQLGPINFFLRQIGIENPPGWLAERRWALFSVTMINVWAYMGGNAMLIFLAGLQGVPRELYEASEIDGAGSLAKFWNVTLPTISPVVLFNVVLIIIASLKVFTTAWVATKGGPSYATWFFALHIYQQAFQYFRLGYGSSLAWLLAVLLIAFTLLQLWLSKRWVHYEGEVT